MSELAKPRRLTKGQKLALKAHEPSAHALSWSDVPTDGSGASHVRTLVEGVGAEWVDVLTLVVESGYGLTISATRDGGALALSLLTEQGPLKRYAGHPDEVAQLIRGLRTHLTQRIQGQVATS